MKINSFQPSLLIVALIILIPASAFAISSTLNTCMDSTPGNSLPCAPSLFSMNDTIDQNNVSLKDRKGQLKASRIVKHENLTISKEEGKKTKKDNFGVALAITSIISFVIFGVVGYHFCKDLD